MNTEYSSKSGQSDDQHPHEVDLLRHAEQINKALFAISNAVNTTPDLKDLYRSIHRSLGGIFDVTNFFIAIVDSRNHTLHFPYHVDTEDDDFSPITDFDTDSSLTGLVVLQRRPTLLREKELRERAAQNGIWGPVPLIWLGVPLMAEDTVIGVMALQSYSDAYLFNDQDLQVLSAVSHQIAIAIDRKRSRDELQESEERLRAILESSPDPIVVYDLKGHPRYLNPAFTQLFGWSLEQVQGVRIPFVPENQKQITRTKISELYTTRKPVRFETKRLSETGDLYDILISAGTIRDIAGKPAGMVVTLTDITEKNRLTSQFHAAQKLESIGTLAGGIAHDFNNLLMGILGHASLLLSDATVFPHMVDHLKGIEGYVKDAADLTKQLLGFARGGKFEVEPTDINRLIQKQNRMFGRTKKEIRIREKYGDDIRTVEIDRGQIEQVILNLYVNAWQAMPGGGDLFVETENTELDNADGGFVGAIPGEYVKITITDTGVGMDESTRRRIFDPFFTTKEMGRGTGLGLASAYGIIKNHGGMIDVTSERGRGTTFCIYLPVSDKAVHEETVTPLEIVRGAESILLVDDEPVIIDVGEQLLKKLGYRVMTARSGREAIDIYREWKDRIDLVILDMIMPDMDGEKTFDRLKAIEPNIRVLLSSGYSLDGKARAILDRGCNGFIQKPFHLNALSEKIRETLGIRLPV